MNPDEHLDAEVLSGYLDQPADFSAAELETIQSHLSACVACQETLADLRAIVATLRTLPEVAPRRSFALTPAMVGITEPAQVRTSVSREAREPIVLQESRPWLERQLGALRWATAVAAILFVFVVVGDLASRPGTLDSGGDEDSAALTTMSQAPASGGATGAEPAEGSGGDSQGLRTTGETPVAENSDTAAAPTPASGSAEDAAPADDGAAGGGSAPTDADTGSGGDDTTTAMQAPGSPTAEQPSTFAESEATESADPARDAVPVPVEQETDSDSTEYWRLAQVALALVIVWLMAAMIALPRWSPRGRK